MAYSIQVCVDCVDAHAQADWWAETLGWVVEPTDENFIRSMIAQGYAADSDTQLHHGRLVWRAGAAICPPEQVGSKGRQRILFQPVPEPKTVKDRIHLDIHLGSDGKEDVRPALEARGASFLYEQSQGPFSWYTMADPEGNEFCIASQ